MHNRLKLAIAVTLAGAIAFAESLPINTDVVAKSVVFIFDSQNKPVGTGFLIEIPLKHDPSQVKLALVTARHIVDPQWAGCPVPNPVQLFARFNKKGYVANSGQEGTRTRPVTLVNSNNEPVYFNHSDEKVDAVVIPISRPEFVVENEVERIRLADFGSDEEVRRFKIGVGDSIVSAGLVPLYANEKRNYAAFKFGRVSNVFDQPIEKSRCGPSSPPRAIHSWLVAGNFVGGNSGSPVFLLPLDFTLGTGLEYHGPRPMLLGIVSASVEGADLAEMTPVEYVFEIIKAHYPEADLYRGDLKDKPKPSANSK